MMNPLTFHPALVHIPLALGVLMPLISLSLLLAWWRGWLPARSWAIAVVLQAILVGSGLLAMEAGEKAEERVEDVVSERLIEAHEEKAEHFVQAAAAVWLLMAGVLAASGRRYAMPLGGAAVAGSVVVLLLGVSAGHAGGELVYTHGAARAYVQAAAADGRFTKVGSLEEGHAGHGLAHEATESMERGEGSNAAHSERHDADRGGLHAGRRAHHDDDDDDDD